MPKNGKLMKSIAPVLFINLLVFLLISTIGFFMSSLNNRNSENQITDWKFVWGNTEKEIEGPISNWSYSNKLVKICEELGSTYIRLNYTLPASADEHVLQLTTANYPIKVDLNGKPIYNNQYGTSDYTGNQQNLIDIPPSNVEQAIDIFAKVTFSFSIDATLVKNMDQTATQSVYNLIGLITGLAIIIIGFLLILVSMLLSVKHRNLGYIVLLGFITVLSGVSLFLNQIGAVFPNLSDPTIFKLQFVIFMFIFAGVNFITVGSMNRWSIPSRIFSIITFLYAVAFSVITNGVVFKIMLMFFPVVSIICILSVVVRISECVFAQEKYAKLTLFSFIFFTFTLLYDSINLILGFTSQFTQLKYIGITTYILIEFSVLIKQAIYINIRLDEREIQNNKNTSWIKRVIEACADIFIQIDKNSFFIQTAKSIRELVVYDVVDRANDQVDKDTIGNDISLCVATFNNNEFYEIYNEGTISECDYETIRQYAEKGESNRILYGRHYLDVAIFGKQDIIFMIHIEGITGGMSDNLKNILKITYNNICIAFDNLILKKDIVITQESVFLEIAEIAEHKSHNSGVHLQSVAGLVRVICEELEMDKSEIDLVSSASMVHDIGKLAIPEGIMKKSGTLTEDEFEIMKQHVIFGYNILSRSPGDLMQAGAIIAKEHHERYDGSGYIGLKGDQIHLYARITAIVDVFDALSSERSYKEAWSYDKVYKYINEQSGKHFDPKIVDAFNRCKDKLIKVHLQTKLMGK